MIGALLSNVISFPGLGIGEFTLDPVAFRIPIPWKDGVSHPIMWYGIIIAFAMIVAFCVALNRAKVEGIKTDDVFDLAIYVLIFAIIGARLYYIIWDHDQIHSFYDAIAIWNGGLAIYGGVIAGAATIFVYSKIKKTKTAKVLDIAAPALIIGQAIGRWGNFCNAEAHGTVTDLPWRMGLIKNGIGTMQYYHPTFLYESLWNVLGFIIIMSLYKKKKYDGAPTLWYLVWYGFGRFFIEGLRTDSLYFLEGVFGQTIRVSQAVAALCVIGGVVLMMICSARARNRALAEAVYEEVYSDKADVLGLDEAPAYDIKESETASDNADGAGDSAEGSDE